jgi:hypothetical protein
VHNGRSSSLIGFFILANLFRRGLKAKLSSILKGSPILTIFHSPGLEKGAISARIGMSSTIRNFRDFSLTTLSKREKLFANPLLELQEYFLLSNETFHFEDETLSGKR